MKNVNTLFKMKEEALISLKQNYIKSLEDIKFRDYIRTLPIEEDILMKYTSTLKDACGEFYNCRDCSSLNECKNKIKGYLLTPSRDNNKINFSYVSCKYEKEQLYKKNIILFDVPKMIKNANLRNVYKEKNRLEIIKYIKGFLAKYNKDQVKGLYLHGSFGSGKTYLVAALFNELARKGEQSVIVHFPELLRGLKESFSTNYSEKFDLIKNTPLLLIDDIGAEYLTAWGRDEVLESILQYRMDEELVTFFTSNLNLEQLETHLSVVNNNVDKLKARRIIERIKKLSIPMELVGRDIRNE